MKHLTINDPDYPLLLKQVYKPPQKLFYSGDLSAFKSPALAIVGTRKYSEYGEQVTRKIIEELSHTDIVIVSGLAKGIDTIAHEAALQSNLKTIAVLGNGLDQIYPRQNTALAEQIAHQGLILTEFPPNTPPQKYNFPQRNRIISGLSLGTLIIECPEKSGAMNTASHALHQSREIFTVPQDFYRTTAAGPLQLLQKSAAYPVQSGRDILEILNIQPTLFDSNMSTEAVIAPTQTKPNSQQKILSTLNRYRLTPLSKIAEKTTLPISELLATLSILELKGLIEIKNEKYLRAC